MISSKKYSNKEIKRLMLCDTGSRWDGNLAPRHGLLSGVTPGLLFLSFFIKERSGKLSITGKTKQKQAA